MVTKMPGQPVKHKQLNPPFPPAAAATEKSRGCPMRSAQLNQRLQNGEPGKLLVAWLNSRPEVQAILAAPNLSAWRKGGYVDWEDE